MPTKVITYHLEMTDPADLLPSRRSGVDLEIRQVKIPCPQFNRFFYTAVGGDWFWIDRLKWTFDQWLAYVDRPVLQTWAAYVDGTPAGYFELEKQPGAQVEIAYFGLLPPFVGQGLGGRLLTAAVESAWEMKASRVWLHTCSLDHPGALANYRARGFRIFKEVISYQKLPEHPPGPWAGSSSLRLASPKG
jgi:GNAT superfamily N-acetyltransferase